MTPRSLADELKIWIGDDEKRRAFMIKEAPIGESTLRNTMGGRYLPGKLLTRALRAVMKDYPKSRPLPELDKAEAS